MGERFDSININLVLQFSSPITRRTGDKHHERFLGTIKPKAKY